MSNRINDLFERKEKGILSIYLTAGYPQRDDTVAIIRNLEAAGVDMIEIGFPFSDPLADGPVIQQSSQKAIDNGMRLELLFEQLSDIRTYTKLPLILMGYLNPVLQYGEAEFIYRCAEIGIDGIIIPDMPLDYYKQQLQQICIEKNIANILLITPETTEDRIREIDKNSKGFIYMVSSNSITGSNEQSLMRTEYFERIRAMELRNKTLIGFGISETASFNTACEFSSGGIIGSAFIKHLKEFGIDARSVRIFVEDFRGSHV